MYLAFRNQQTAWGLLCDGCNSRFFEGEGLYTSLRRLATSKTPVRGWALQEPPL